MDLNSHCNGLFHRQLSFFSSYLYKLYGFFSPQGNTRGLFGSTLAQCLRAGVFIMCCVPLHTLRAATITIFVPAVAALEATLRWSDSRTLF